MGIDSNSLVKVQTFRSFLGEDDSEFDSIFEFLINAVSTEAQNYIHRDLRYAAAHSESLSGTGRSILYLPAWPIHSVTSVAEDGTTLSEDDEDFFVHSGERGWGKLEKASGAVWSKGVKNIDVVWAAGYDLTGDVEEMPKDLQLAICEQVGAVFKMRNAEDWLEVSKSFPDGSTSRLISVVEADLLPAVMKILDRYRRLSA